VNQHQLLVELFHRGVKVWADGDQLRVRAPQGALTPELRDSLAVHKQEILSSGPFSFRIGVANQA